MRWNGLSKGCLPLARSAEAASRAELAAVVRLTLWRPPARLISMRSGATISSLGVRKQATLGSLRLTSPWSLPRLAFSTTSTAPNNSSRYRFWRRLAAIVRIVRIPALVMSVFGLGYQQGIVDCTRSPQALQEQIFRSVLASVGVSDWKQVQVLGEQDISYVSRTPHHQVAAVGDRIISSARTLVQEELDNAMQNVQRKLPVDILPEDAMKYIKADKKVEFWFNAAQRLLGEVNSTNILVDLMVSDDAGKPDVTTTARLTGTKLKKVPWQYVFIQSEQPNAFVSEILPQRFFITSAMMELATNQNELAMVLGHEVSHLILGHVSQTNQVETMLRTLEILLLSIDPTEGVLALVVIGGLVAIRKALSAAHSRDNEQEADDLGIQITARACYDTVSGAEIMNKMHQAKVAMMKPPSGTKNSVSASGDAVTDSDTKPVPTELQLFDTHPPTLERYERLQEKAVAGENFTKYRHDQCATMSSRLAAALGWG